MSLWQDVSRQIQQTDNSLFTATSQTSMGGGCINSAYRISDGTTDYFVKLNSTLHGDMFEVEYLTLLEMANSHTLKVPHPVCFGESGNQAYLVLEFLDLSGRVDPILQGQQLAEMHRHTAQQFGWQRSNTIGSTPQQNTYMDDWVDFWREQRLLPQLKLAIRNGYGKSLGNTIETLISRFPVLFSSYQPEPSMLHGDLWGGNAAALSDGSPVIFDPAFYYGDRETDLAMTTLFGGFSPDFYTAYNDAWPLDDGYVIRKSLYNLYHLLNHLNLFGTGYLGQSISLAEKVLAEI